MPGFTVGNMGHGTCIENANISIVTVGNLETSFGELTGQKFRFRLIQLAPQRVESYCRAITFDHIKGIILTPGLKGQLAIDYYKNVLV